jgi:hypothetical protein
LLDSTTAESTPIEHHPMAKGSTFDNDLLKLIFNGVGIPNIADNAASSPLTTLYIALHTADPGVGGSQTTNEAAYTGYARQPVARSTSGWTVTGSSVNPVADINFPIATAGSETEGYFSVGTALSGAGKILYSGAISPNIAVAVGVTPVLTEATAVTES